MPDTLPLLMTDPPEANRSFVEYDTPQAGIGALPNQGTRGICKTAR